MIWVRTNRGSVRAAAVGAVCVLAGADSLSFGHVHLDKGRCVGTPPRHRGRRTGFLGPRVAANAPPDQTVGLGAADFCAICATLSMASPCCSGADRSTRPFAHFAACRVNGGRASRERAATAFSGPPPHPRPLCWADSAAARAARRRKTPSTRLGFPLCELGFHGRSVDSGRK